MKDILWYFSKNVTGSLRSKYDFYIISRKTLGFCATHILIWEIPFNRMISRYSTRFYNRTFNKALSSYNKIYRITLSKSHQFWYPVLPVIPRCIENVTKASSLRKNSKSHHYVISQNMYYKTLHHGKPWLALKVFFLLGLHSLTM